MQRAFSSGFLNSCSLFLLFVVAFVDFACAAILLFSVPKLEVCCVFSAFYAGRAVLTEYLRVIRRVLLLFLFIHGPTMITSTQTLSIPTEHPWANHDNVQIRPGIHSRRASMDVRFGVSVQPNWGKAFRLAAPGLSREETPGPPNDPLMEPLWSLMVGIWGIIEGSWGV